jgi:hypothetical protein
MNGYVHARTGVACTYVQDVYLVHVSRMSKICELNCKTIHKNTIEIYGQNKCYLSETNNDILQLKHTIMNFPHDSGIA